MKEYVLIFRMDITTKSLQPNAKQMKIYMQDWMKWINKISETNQLAEGGHHLSYTEASVLRPNNLIENKPYSINNESVAGYIIVLSKNLKGAVSIAKKCPILKGKNTSVEVRQIATL